MIETMKEIIEAAIASLEEKHKYELNNSSIHKHEGELESLKDYHNIINIDLGIIKEVLNDLDYTDDEKIVIYKFICSIKTLLELNKTKNTTFTISNQQISYLKMFLEKAKERKEKIEKENTSQIATFNKKINSYKELLNKITNPKNKSFITELALLDEMFNELNIDIGTRKLVLIAVLKYNKELFNQQMISEKAEPKVDRLDINEVEELFKKYNYEFKKLKPKQQDFILNYASISNMDELFKTLERLNFPYFNLPKDSSKLATILINCDKKTIEMIVDFSKSRGITPTDLTALVPVLVEQRNRNIKKPGQINPPKEESPIISGKSKDYMDNIEFLENLGFDILYIYNKCRELLVVNHERLKQNLEAFNTYGFKFDQDTLGNLTHPALSCLLSSNFIEVVDQFIEICPKGFDYIKENMSRILTYSDPKGLLFYNIYASYMNTNEYGDDLIPEGPFNKYFKLRGEITRYAGSGYRNIPYRGVTEDNKQEKTMTINPPIKNKDLFDEKVEEVKIECKPLKNLIIQNQTLEKLDEYIDQDNPFRYNFNGILISKIKVERIYNIILNYGLENEEDSLLYAVLYNTIINKNDYEKVKQIVKGWSK